MTKALTRPLGRELLPCCLQSALPNAGKQTLPNSMYLILQFPCPEHVSDLPLTFKVLGRYMWVPWETLSFWRLTCEWTLKHSLHVYILFLVMVQTGLSPSMRFTLKSYRTLWSSAASVRYRVCIEWISQFLHLNSHSHQSVICSWGIKVCPWYADLVENNLKMWNIFFRNAYNCEINPLVSQTISKISSSHTMAMGSFRWWIIIKLPKQGNITGIVNV